MYTISNFKTKKCPDVRNEHLYAKGNNFTKCCKDNLKDEEACKCPDGYYLSGCENENTTGKCLPYCKPGSYWDEIKKTCVKTPAGTYIEFEGASEPGSVCFRNLYSYKGEDQVCKQCLRGKVIKDKHGKSKSHDDDDDCTKCAWNETPNNEGDGCEAVETYAPYAPESGLCENLTEKECFDSNLCLYRNRFFPEKIHSCIPLKPNLDKPNNCDVPKNILNIDESKSKSGFYSNANKNSYKKYIILVAIIGFLITLFYIIKKKNLF